MWSEVGRFVRSAGLVALASAVFGSAGADETPDTSGLDRVVDEVLGAYDHESVLVIGELHGTEETPFLVHALAERLADDGASVVIGLEMSRQEQARIDEFMSSDGSASAQTAVLDGEFWRGSDGRTSRAIFQLLERVRVARQSGSAVSVVAIDDSVFFDEGVERRDGLAGRIIELHRSPDHDVAVVLIGNYHARLSAPTRVISDGELLNDPPVPTAARITDVPLTTVNVTACAGGFWTCTSPGSCGLMEIPDSCGVRELPVVETLDPAEQGYHLVITLEKLTPSPPARR